MSPANGTACSNGSADGSRRMFSITCSRHVQGIGPGCRPGGRHDRRHHRKGSPLGPGRRRGTLCRAIGRSRAGITTKTPVLTDALGNLVDFCLMPGQAHDLRETASLPHDVSAGHLLADRALDAGWLRNDLPDRDMTPVIPPKSNRRFPAGFDNETCKWRHLISKIALVNGRKTGEQRCAHAKQTRASRLSSRLPLPSFTQGKRQQTLGRRTDETLTETSWPRGIPNCRMVTFD